MITLGLKKHTSGIPILTRVVLLLCFFILLTTNFRTNNGTLWYSVFACFLLFASYSYVNTVRKDSSIFILWRFSFWAWCGLSILWTIDIQTALESYIRSFTVLYLIFTLTLFVIKSPEDLESLIDIYFLASVLSIIYIVLNVDLAVVAAGARLGVSQDEVDISPNDTAMVCVNGILLFFYLLRRDGYINFKALYYLISFVLFVVILVVTGSRRAILTLLVAGFLYIVIENRSIFKSTFKLTLFSIAIIFLFNLLMENEVFSTILGDRIMGVVGGEESFSTHKDMIDRGWKYFFEKPLFGSGHLSFIELYGKETGKYMFSHNNYTELLVNYGIVGFLLYYWFIIWLIVRLYRMTTRYIDKQAMFFLIVLLAQFVSNWSNVGHIMLTNEFMVILAFAVVRNRKYQKSVIVNIKK